MRRILEADKEVQMGRDIFLNGALGSDGNTGLTFDKPKKTLTEADNLLRTGYFDTIWLMPSVTSVSLAAAYDWSFNCCRLMGPDDQTIINPRARIGMSTTFTPMITVSGYGNTFANIYTMHGTAAGDYVGWLISGNRNKFKNVHFGGPMVAAQGGHASYIGVNITGTENTFEGCIFGTSTIGRDEVTPNVKMGPGRNFFKNCVFMLYLDDGDPLHFLSDNSSGTTEAWFQGCQFIALNANWATPQTVAFEATAPGAGGATCGWYFDNNCQFINVSALCATDVDQFLFLPRQFVTTTDTEGMISPVLTI